MNALLVCSMCVHVSDYICLCVYMWKPEKKKLINPIVLISVSLNMRFDLLATLARKFQSHP